jgi:hypothetical protein
MTNLDPSSYDLTGISVATAAPGDNPRTGTVYNPVVFAAGAPVWFHPMPGGSHLMVRARRWSAATRGGFSLFQPVLSSRRGWCLSPPATT